MKLLKVFAALIFAMLIVWIVINNYSVIFAKTVVGVVTSVERIEIPVAMISRSDAEINSKVFSFAIGIKDRATGEIFTASSEDRQWAVAEKGQCAEAKFLPYPPWDFSKEGTYFGARLIKLSECPAEVVPPK